MDLYDDVPYFIPMALIERFQDSVLCPVTIQLQQLALVCFILVEDLINTYRVHGILSIQLIHENES